MKFHEQALVILLRVGGTLMSIAFLAIFLPVPTMAAIHEGLGLGEFPAVPITDYLSRSIAAFYGFHGVLLWIVSTDVKRFDPLVAYVGVMNLVLGAMLIAIDLYAGMPSWWTLGEGPPVIVTGALILFLRQKSRAHLG